MAVTSTMYKKGYPYLKEVDSPPELLQQIEKKEERLPKVQIGQTEQEVLYN